jgi:membrane protein
MNLSQIEWRTVGKAVLKGYNDDDVAGLASEMAFNFIFALFPFIIFVSTLTGLIGRLIGADQLFSDIMGELYRALPPASADAVRQPLEEVLTQEQGGALSLGALLALWFASRGVATIMKAFNRAYGAEETRGFVVKTLVALALTLVMSVLLIGGFVLLLFGGTLGAWVAERFGLGRAFGPVWHVARLLLVLLGISLALAILYWKGPNVRQDFKWLTPGSVLVTLVWVAVTAGFGLYVRLLGASAYSKYYGTIFGLILFLFYLYLTSTVILLGAELNAETTKRYDPQTIRDKVGDPRKQLPGKQPSPHPQAAAEAGVSPREVAETNIRSAAKLANGAGSPASATAAAQAKNNGEGDGERPLADG